MLASCFLLLASGASAQTTGNTTSTAEEKPVCELAKSLDELLAVKDGALTGIARDRAEFAARKALLDQTIVCATLEIEETKTKLGTLELREEDAFLRAQFLDELAKNKETYSSYAKEVSTSTGLLEIKDLAEKILSWRTETYLPLLQKTNDLILVATNQKSIAVARSRFNKISTALGILRLTSVPSVNKLLTEAGTLTKEAERLTAEAHTIVLSYAVPVKATSTASSTSQTILTASSSTMLTASGTLATTTKIPDTTALELVRASLESLRGAYTNYLEISSVVKIILGL